VSIRPKARPGARAGGPGCQEARVPLPAPNEVDPATLAPGTRLVQFGTFDTAEEARAEWTRLQGRFGDLMAGKAMVVQPAESGGRTFYRLRAHGFEDEDDARRFCSAFVAENAVLHPGAAQMTVGSGAAIFGCAGPRLLPEERAFFRDADPFGFILFARNVEDPDQLRRLTGDLRERWGAMRRCWSIRRAAGCSGCARPHWRSGTPPAGHGGGGAIAARRRADAAAGVGDRGGTARRSGSTPTARRWRCGAPRSRIRS
jgi:hypothetical protein